MRELLSKKSHRQLELLELLFKNKRWFHISELAELLNCTERSVKDDLSHVKSAFPQLIFHSSTNGIRIINTDDSDIEMVYHHFFKHSTHFSILEFIFFNEGYETESLCKEFYISSSSLYRIISHINKIIKKCLQNYFFICYNRCKFPQGIVFFLKRRYYDSKTPRKSHAATQS